MHHPSIDGLADSFIGLSVRLICNEEECLVISKDEHLLHALVNLFTWLQEEVLRPVDQNLLA